jgi:hypothetical protein
VDKTAIEGPGGRALREKKLLLALSRLDEDKERGPRVQDLVVLPVVSQMNLGELIGDLFRPRRKLNPQRKERQVTGMNYKRNLHLTRSISLLHITLSANTTLYISLLQLVFIVDYCRNPRKLRSSRSSEQSFQHTRAKESCCTCDRTVII